MTHQHIQRQAELPREHARRTAATLRAAGFTIRGIAAETGTDRGHVYNLLDGQARGAASRIPPAANDNKRVVYSPHNGGCSSLSGMLPVSLARVPTMERAPVAFDDLERTEVAA